MKLAKAKKFEESLVVVLEFVRVTAQTNPKIASEVLQKIGISPEAFTPRLNRLVKLALKNADIVGVKIQDVLRALRKEANRQKETGKITNIYADVLEEQTANDDDDGDYEKEPDDTEDE